MKTWLIVDCHGLCHQALHSMGALSHGDMKTGVIFGFFKDVIGLKDDMGTDDIVFAFDSRKNRRHELFPAYKEKRHSKELSEDEVNALIDFRKQVKRLRTEWLPQAGFSNVFHQEGYEADDVIASVVSNLPDDDEAIIVSCDGDLYQLLNERVSFYNFRTRKMTTSSSFFKDKGLRPKQWAHVKAIGGCSTDEVPGVEGIGEITAIKYLKGELKESSVKFQRIESTAGQARIARNWPLVKLPFSAVDRFDLQPDAVTDEKWKQVADALGMKSLRGAAPMLTRSRRNMGIK